MKMSWAEKKDYKDSQFEFLLKINGNIVCQRLFDFDGYNEEVLNSEDIKWLVDDCVDVIESDFKVRSIDNLWEYFNPYFAQNEYHLERIRQKKLKPHVFTFEIKVDGRTVIEKMFDGSIYTPNVKYQINIKELVPILISYIERVFTQKKFVSVYSGVK